MKQILLHPDEVLKGYDVLSELYPHIPSLSIWRAWEYAAYQRYQLAEPVLDLGCGDGRYFHLLWPQINDVIGVDISPEVAEAARQSGVYRETVAIPAHQLPFPTERFSSVFANCSLEHMDHLSDTLKATCRSLHMNGTFLLSVVTEHFIDWTMLPLLIGRAGERDLAKKIQNEYEAYHHLTSPFSPEIWVERLEAGGFEVLEHIPILPEITSRLFLFLDQLWHLKTHEGEFGNDMHSFLVGLSEFPRNFRHVLDGILKMERDWSTGSGAVFWARRVR